MTQKLAIKLTVKTKHKFTSQSTRSLTLMNNDTILNKSTRIVLIGHNVHSQN